MRWVTVVEKMRWVTVVEKIMLKNYMHDLLPAVTGRMP